MRSLMLLAALLLASTSFAENKTVAWANATTNTDNSPIPASGAGSLTRTTVEYGSCVGTPKAFGTKVGEIFVAAPANTLQLALVVVQEYCLRAFHSNTFATTFALNAPGNSGPSNVAVTTVAPPSPKPPANLAVTDPTAYEIRTSSGQLVASRLGLVQLGTLCNSGESQTVSGVTYYRVDLHSVDLVNWPSATPTNAKAWARCG